MGASYNVILDNEAQERLQLHGEVHTLVCIDTPGGIALYSDEHQAKVARQVELGREILIEDSQALKKLAE